MRTGRVLETLLRLGLEPEGPLTLCRRLRRCSIALYVQTDRMVSLLLTQAIPAKDDAAHNMLRFLCSVQPFVIRDVCML